MELRAYMNRDLLEIRDLIQNELGYSISAHDLDDRITQMQKDGNYQINVATKNGSIIGFIGISMGFAFEIPGRVMNIIALAVSARHQGSGVGSALMRMAEDLGRANHVSAILVNSGMSREAAHRFYEKQGFNKKGYGFMKKI